MQLDSAALVRIRQCLQKYMLVGMLNLARKKPLGKIWRDDREAEGARLLSECTPMRCTEGSNPSLSASTTRPETLSQTTGT